MGLAHMPQCFSTQVPALLGQRKAVVMALRPLAPDPWAAAVGLRSWFSTFLAGPRAVAPLEGQLCSVREAFLEAQARVWGSPALPFFYSSVKPLSV